MSIHKIIKQELLSEPFTGDTLKFMRAIYNTYINENENISLEIKLQTILNHLKLSVSKESVQYIITILEDMNEPLVVKDFKFYHNVYPMRYVTFCKYKINEDTIDIELSEEFLLVEKEYMTDSFLSN